MARAITNLSSLLANDYGFTESEVFDLELLIDRRGLEQILQQIADICAEKAVHIQGQWQDAALAQQWDGVALAIAKTAAKAVGL
jgi:hypothetical protein